MIGRLLSRLEPAARDGDLDVIVVANGCSDGTAALAASFGPGIRVLTLDTASKHAALAAGDLAATGFPRIYLDADVELGAADIGALARALQEPGVLAAAPTRVLALDGRPWLVRWYYDIWLRLPEVRQGLFGRGVIAVGPDGHERLAGMPALLADDLAASLRFGRGERRVVTGARVTIYPPQTFGDLLRRRVRAAESVTQLEQAQWSPGASARTRPADLAAIARARPRAIPKLALFLAVALLARWRARRSVARGDYSAWRRDESSRESPCC